MSSAAIFNILQSAGSLLVILLGLWIAGRLVLRWMASPQVGEGSSLLLNRSVLLVAWLALGRLFSLPFIDLLRVINFLRDLLSPASMLSFNTITTWWGSAPVGVQAIANLLIILVAYTLVLWTGLVSLRKRETTFPRISFLLTRSERVFSLLVVASLVSELVRNFILNILFLRPQPSTDWGLLGYLAGLGVALVATGVGLLLIDQRLSKAEA